MDFKHASILFLVALSLTQVAGCGSRGPAADSGSGYVDIGIVDTFELIRKNRGNGDFVIVDVRTPEEFTGGHIEGAVNIDYQSPGFENQMATFDRAKIYLVYCRTGNRSRGAVDMMSRLGFKRVYHMVDGIVAWQQKGYPLSN